MKNRVCAHLEWGQVVDFGHALDTLKGDVLSNSKLNLSSAQLIPMSTEKTSAVSLLPRPAEGGRDQRLIVVGHCDNRRVRVRDVRHNCRVRVLAIGVTDSETCVDFQAQHAEETQSCSEDTLKTGRGGKQFRTRAKVCKN
jgi:hypothetical protein